MVLEAQQLSSGARARRGRRGGTRRWAASHVSPPTLCISEIGLSLPERCLFVLPRRGLKKERMQAARVERQGQAE